MSVNKVILIGNVGKDPEVRYLDKNVAVASFTLATTERGFTMQNGTQVPDRTEWHNIVAWRGLAEVAEKYVKKGTQLYIEGKIQTRSWEKDGIKRYTTEILADNMQLLGRKPENAESASAQASSPAPAPQAAQSSSEPAIPPAEEEESGLPF
jgi:single-strand DNA-binding protein